MPTYRRTYVLALATTFIVLSISSVGFLILQEPRESDVTTTASGAIELLATNAFMSLLLVGSIFGVFSGLCTMIHLSRLMGKRVATDSSVARALAIVFPVSEAIPPGMELSDHVIVIWKKYRLWDLRFITQMAICGGAALFLVFVLNVQLS